MGACLQFQRLSPWPSWRGVRQQAGRHEAGAVAESLNPDLKAADRDRQTDTGTHTDIQREWDRQTDRQTDRHTHTHTHTHQAIDIGLGYPPELDSRIIFLKTPSSLAKHGEITLELTRKLLPDD